MKSRKTHLKAYFVSLLLLTISNQIYGDFGDFNDQINDLLTKREIIQNNFTEFPIQPNRTVFESSLSHPFALKVSKLSDVEKCRLLLENEKELLRTKSELLKTYKFHNENRGLTLSKTIFCMPFLAAIAGIGWVRALAHKGLATRNYPIYPDACRRADEDAIEMGCIPVIIVNVLIVAYILRPRFEIKTDDLEEDIKITEKRIFQLADKMATKFPDQTWCIPAEEIINRNVSH